MKIAIQGERGSFSHQAALQLFPDAQIEACMLSREVFERAVQGEVDAIAVPLENTLAGAVVDHYDLLREFAVEIQAETVVRIEHHVIGVPGSRLGDLRRVYSHPVALAQCHSFFREHPQIEPVSFYDTAGAVRHVVQGVERCAAAIAGAQAAGLYGGKVLAEKVEDDAANYTRFVLARRAGGGELPDTEHKLSVCVDLDPRPGSLLQLLAAVEELRGDVCQLVSRPLKGRPWRYHFFLDALLPHAAAAQRLVEQLPALCRCHKVLGRYLAAQEFMAERAERW